MKTIKFDDPWMANQKACNSIQSYLGTCQELGSVGRVAWMDAGGKHVVLLVEVNSSLADKLIDTINEFLIVARLDFAQNCVLKHLAWSFSSPVKTAKLREILESKHNQTG